MIQLAGNATGDSVGSSAASNLQFDADGTMRVNLAAGKPLIFQDSSGNNIGQFTESSRQTQCVKVPLAAVDTAGGAFSWVNPEGVAIIVERVEIDVTTIATGACTLSVGQTATSGTTSSANLIDTLDVHSATGVFDNITDKGTNGKSRQKVAAGKWVTGSVASGASAGLVGNAYIFYHRA